MNRRFAAVASALAVGLGALAIGVRSNQVSAAQVGDGTTSASAGASCWGIKQVYPTSTDGTYWLQTPGLVEPAQFYCDMTTDGGGWVLIGRGREGWSWLPKGQGAAGDLWKDPVGPAGFSPDALSIEQVTGLMNGGRVDALTDGVRLRRATNTQGGSWQELRWRFASLDRWTWAFEGGMPLVSTTIDGQTYSGGNTRDSLNNVTGQAANALAGQNGLKRTWTWSWSSHQYRAGFSFGSGPTGSNSSTSYLWQSASEGSPIPFTQVFVRPRIANGLTYPAIPTGGMAAEPKPAGLKIKPTPTGWGVVGADHTNEERVEPWKTPVMDVEYASGRVFVGGRFTGVSDAAGNVSTQAYLASFDAATGSWDQGFRPTLDGRVWDIVQTADGKLIVGGDFTNVNGVPNTAGLAALDPATGQVLPGWSANVTREDGTGARAIVRALAVHGTDIYVGGNFTHIKGGTWNKIQVSRAIKLQAANGSPDSSWRPKFTSSVVDLEVSSQGDRVYATGFFNATNGDTTRRYASVVDTGTGALVSALAPWRGEARYGDRYQQTATEAGDRFFIGGAEHIFQMFDRSTGAILASKTAYSGGDFQESILHGGKVYAACHCGGVIYEGTNSWGGPPPSFSKVNKVYLFAAFDPASGEQDVDFVPEFKGDGDGPWAFTSTPDGCLWTGGQFTEGGWNGSGYDYAAGFARFCPKDTTPPTAPANLKASVTGSDVKLTWSASSDAAALRYWVYRDDRVVGVTYGTSWTDVGRSGTGTYWVRAVDETGNRSASTGGLAVTVVSPAGGGAGQGGAVVTPLIAVGSPWRWKNDAPPPAEWAQKSFDDSSWTENPAELGWGDGDEATVIPNVGLTTYFRRSFTVPNAAQVASAEIRIRRDDAAAVYVNGLEVHRSNLPEGLLAPDTSALDYISGSAEQAWTVLRVPGSLLTTGTNTVAVELHQKGASNGDASFDLELVPVAPGTDTTPPGTPSPTVTATTSSSVTLAWPSIPDAAGWLVERDGTPIRVVGGDRLGMVDDGLATGSSHTWKVRAFDAAGNLGTGASVSATTSPDPLLVAKDAAWRWTYDGNEPAAGWNTSGFNDAGWAQGAAELGYGDGDEATVISAAAAPRPVTGYFRRTFVVADPTRFTNLELQLIRDDGAAVYVNGQEVLRDNLPAGPLTQATGATTTLSTTSVERTPVVVTIPASVLVAGSNTIAVEVHNSNAWSGDLSFSLQVTAVA